MLASAQLQILDGFAGPEQAARRERYREAYGQERALFARLGELRERAGARDRELDLLEWELAEIDRADPSEEEEAALDAERYLSAQEDTPPEPHVGFDTGVPSDPPDRPEVHGGSGGLPPQ